MIIKMHDGKRSKNQIDRNDIYNFALIFMNNFQSIYLNAFETSHQIEIVRIHFMIGAW